MTKPSIHYICCFYFGNRQNKKYTEKLKKDPYYFLDKHIEFLNSSPEYVTSATFVFNIDSGDPAENLVRNYFSKYSNNNISIEFIIRNNSGFSYGAWGEIIEKNINKKFDYFFIIEDDYIPIEKTFLKYFVEKCSKKFPYVCCRVVDSCSQSNIPHASISNGLIDAKICLEVYEKNSKVFNINCGKSYFSAYQNQLFFYSFFQNMGYGMVDVLDKYKIPFMISDTNTPIYFGDVNNPLILCPIEV